MINENLRWLLSFYRSSEISGALFFGQLARALRPSPIQQDMTRHFADEASHARYWTECMERLGVEPFRLGHAYQDQYVAAAGMPVNLMEILAITQVFEKRVVGHYALHAKAPNLNPEISKTLQIIMEDERWHLKWVREALISLEDEYGAEEIKATLSRFTNADREVYRKTVREHNERIDQLRLAKR